MPKRTDLRKILIIGSGPIVIGQACEFDYSGTQACKALREEGYEGVLVNSNPAPIMTDPSTADRTYIEPLTLELAAKVIEKERPDALCPPLGGAKVATRRCCGRALRWAAAARRLHLKTANSIDSSSARSRCRPSARFSSRNRSSGGKSTRWR